MSVGEDGRARIWNVARGTCLHELPVDAEGADRWVGRAAARGRWGAERARVGAVVMPSWRCWAGRPGEPPAPPADPPGPATPTPPAAPQGGRARPLRHAPDRGARRPLVRLRRGAPDQPVHAWRQRLDAARQARAGAHGQHGGWDGGWVGGWAAAAACPADAMRSRTACRRPAGARAPEGPPLACRSQPSRVAPHAPPALPRPAQVESLRFDAGGSLLATYNGGVSYWNFAQRGEEEKQELPLPAPGAVLCGDVKPGACVRAPGAAVAASGGGGCARGAGWRWAACSGAVLPLSAASRLPPSVGQPCRRQLHRRRVSKALEVWVCRRQGMLWRAPPCHGHSKRRMAVATH